MTQEFYITERRMLHVAARTQQRGRRIVAEDLAQAKELAKKYRRLKRSVQVIKDKADRLLSYWDGRYTNRWYDFEKGSNHVGT